MGPPPTPFSSRVANTSLLLPSTLDSAVSGTGKPPLIMSLSVICPHYNAVSEDMLNTMLSIVLCDCRAPEAISGLVLHQIKSSKWNSLYRVGVPIDNC